MLDENGMVMEVTWDNSESPGQYGLAPEGLYQDRDDSSFQVNLKAEIVTDAFTNLPTIVMGYLGDRTIISGNHFTAPDLEQSVIEGTISNDLKTIEVYLVTSAGVEFNRTLIKE